MIRFHDLNVYKSAYINELETKESITVGETTNNTTITKDEINTTTLKGNLSTDYFQQGEDELILDGGNSN